MQISVKRSGGFAGLTENLADVNTATLPAGVKQQVEGAVKSLDFFQLPAAVPDQAVGADYQQYEITVSDGGRQHKVTFYDDESPGVAPLRNLVDKLTGTH